MHLVFMAHIDIFHSHAKYLHSQLLLLLPKRVKGAKKLAAPPANRPPCYACWCVGGSSTSVVKKFAKNKRRKVNKKIFAS